MYVNAYVIPVPDHRKADYESFAHRFAEIAKDFGAVEIFENWEAEIADGDEAGFRAAAKIEPGEKIALSWIVWPDRETARLAHESICEDSRVEDLGDLPFDRERMIVGGFEPLLTYRHDG